MNTVPNAQPPSTMCHQKGIPNAGLVVEPIQLNICAMMIVPTATPAMVRQEATLVQSKTIAPIRHISADVSPSEPGSSPTNAFHHEKPWSANDPAMWRAWPRIVAPL